MRSLGSRFAKSFCGALLVLGCAPAAPAPERIVLIVIDTLRADFATCCGDIATPNLDALTQRGQRLPNAIASHHQTTFSMAALFTGRTPSLEAADGELMPFNGRTWCGVARFARPAEGACIPAALRTLPEFLRESGYWTIGVTSNDLLFAPAGFERGFDDWSQVSDPLPAGPRDPKTRRTPVHWRGRAADRVNEASVSALQRRPSDRFFLYVHYMDAHDYLGGRDAYAEGVEKADAGVGRLLASLEAQGLSDGTVVILVADHGERIGEEHLLEGHMGHSGKPSFEEVLRIPLVIAPAQFEDAGRLVRSQDLFGIILRIARAETELSRDLESDELLISEGRWRTYRRGRWKSFGGRDGQAFHLVDLAADPEELYDVAPLHADVVRRHRERVSNILEGLTARGAVAEDLTSEDERRLRSLGYLE